MREPIQLSKLAEAGRDGRRTIVRIGHRAFENRDVVSVGGAQGVKRVRVDVHTHHPPAILSQPYCNGRTDALACPGHKICLCRQNSPPIGLRLEIVYNLIYCIHTHQETVVKQQQADYESFRHQDRYGEFPRP